MKVNPVYGKEIKLRVRSLKFAMTILLFNLALTAIALFGFEVFFNVNVNSRIDYSGAIKMYSILICIEAAMVAFLVPIFTAGSIAGEREKQTLEILLTTVLKPAQIVFGKLMSSISMVFLLVFSSLPVISIVFTIGGVNMMNLLQFVFVIVVISLYVGSIGMWASSFLKKAVPATVLAFGMLVIICVLTVIIVLVANASANMYYYNSIQSSPYNMAVSTLQVNTVPDVTWAAYFLLINPAFTVLEMVSKQYMAGNLVSQMSSALNGNMPSLFINHWFICSVVVQLVLTCMFLFLATRFLDPLRRKEKERKTKKKSKKKKNKSGDLNE